MKLRIPKTPIPSFQEGGAMPPVEQPGAQGGGDPMQQLQAMVQQYLQTQDPALADQIVMMLAQLMGITGGAPIAPEAGGGMPPEEGMPMGQKGMKIKTVKGRPYDVMIDNKKKTIK